MGRYTPFALVSLLLLAAVVLFAPGSASVEAASSLPPRPTFTPTPENLARILLAAGPDYEDAWTVVQWQDEPGVWHDVEGWQGHVRNGWIRWRVAPKDWGTGPFRWLVYDEAGGTLLASTASFQLPSGKWGIVWVVPQAVSMPMPIPPMNGPAAGD